MGLIKYNLGELLELTTEMNSDLMYGPDDVRGMTITKEIIPTKADVANTNLICNDLCQELNINKNHHKFLFNCY